MKTLAVLCLAASLLFSPTAHAQSIPGRYQFYTLPDGKYAFDTTTGMVYMLMKVAGEYRTEHFEWKQISTPIRTENTIKAVN